MKTKPATTKPGLAEIRAELHSLADPADAIHLQRFFKTGPGEYGAGDRFLGLRVPALRTLASKYAALAHGDAVQMLASSWHEERLLALMLLVNAYKRGDGSSRAEIHQAYLANTAHINNWDLVDASAEHIVGAHLGTAEPALLVKLARSKDVWERRIAIVSTFHFIKREEFGPTFKIAALLMTDTHDLIHKATGWMLREVGKRDRDALDNFLRRHYQTMPRTMLRYAIERHPEGTRKKYLAGTI
ncbi:MAG: DNA alkylation repair protein [Gemmatimonadaceae bacterium]